MATTSTLAVLAAALLLGGCSSTPIATGAARPIGSEKYLAPEYAYPTPRSFTLAVTRDTGMLASACEVTVYIDDEAGARLAAGEKATFFIPAGRHIVGTDSDGICAGNMTELEVEARAGEALSLRIARGSDGHLNLRPVTP